MAPEPAPMPPNQEVVEDSVEEEAEEDSVEMEIVKVNQRTKNKDEASPEEEASPEDQEINRSW